MDTNGRDMLNCLVANNERLTATNATKIADIKSLLTNGENTHANRGLTSGLVSAAGGGSTSSEASALKRQVQQLRSEILLKWMKGGFCFTHGRGVRKGHDSNACLHKGTGRMDTANR